jgi:hypothetical protein
MREALGIYGFLLFYPILRLLKIALAKTPETGARTTIYCAVEPSLERSSDLYFEYVSSIKEYPQKKVCLSITVAVLRPNRLPCVRMTQQRINYGN